MPSDGRASILREKLNTVLEEDRAQRKRDLSGRRLRDCSEMAKASKAFKRTCSRKRRPCGLRRSRSALRSA